MGAWILSVVYNIQSIEEQKGLWNKLSRTIMLNFPCIFIGDFNSITNHSEHKCGCFNHYSCKAVLFNNFIAENSLLDINFTGSEFTQYNGHTGLARRWDLLDRWLVNTTWTSHYSNFYVAHLPRINSDHSPLLLIAQVRVSSSSRIFRFEKTFGLNSLVVKTLASLTDTYETQDINSLLNSPV